MAKCPFCGTFTGERDRKCPGCGTTVDVVAADTSRAAPVVFFGTTDRDREIIERVHSHGKVAAVQFYRDVTGAGLKEAKDAVDGMMKEYGLASQSQSGCLGMVLVVAAAGVAVASLV